MDKERDIVGYCVADAKALKNNIMPVVCCKGFAPTLSLDHKCQKHLVIVEAAWLNYANS